MPQTLSRLVHDNALFQNMCSTQHPPSFIIMKADEMAATLYNCGRITDMYGKAYQYLPHILLPPPLYPDNDVYIIIRTQILVIIN